MAEPIVDEVVEKGEAQAEPEVVEEQVEEAEVVEEIEEEEDEAPEEKPPSRRESLRIQQLLSKLKEKEAGGQPESRAKGLDYKTSLDADEDTVTALEKDRNSYGDSRYQEGLEQSKSIQFHTRLEIDAPRVEAQFPVLDKRSPKFNPVIANALNQMYLDAVGYDPKTDRVRSANVRYADYIESQFELAEELANEKVERTQKNIAKQAATTGLRPSGNSTKRLNLNKAPQDMTDEELDAKLAQTIPQRPRKR